MKSNEIDMTTGSLPKKILMYSVPLMLSNVLQVMFNLCDVAVVGKFVGPLALGAVGSTSIIITLTTGILLGLAGGVNAVVALFVGAKNSANVKRAVHTSIVICMIAGLLLLLSGLFLSRSVLNLIGTKKELIDGDRFSAEENINVFSAAYAVKCASGYVQPVRCGGSW